MMKLQPFGSTGLSISPLTIGGLFTSSLAGGETETRRILQRAVELGINAIDTAPAYADSEETIGRVLRQIDAPLIVTTKLGGRPQPFDPRNQPALIQSVETSLKLLGRESIEVLMVHEPDRPGQYPWWTNYDPLEGPVLEVFDELKRAGKVQHIGLGGTTVNELTSLVRTGLFDVVLTAFQYNALIREAEEELLPVAAEQRMGIMLGSVMGQGFLTKRADTEVRRRPVWMSKKRQEQLLAYYQLLDESGLTAAELCLRFARTHPHVSTIPIGCKTLDHLESSVAAAEKGPLPADILARLNTIAAMLPHRPFEEPMILPLGKDYVGPAHANVGAGIRVGRD